MKKELLKYILKRLLMLIPLILLISIVVFILIQLPPGDFLTTQIARMQMGGGIVNTDHIAVLRNRYGLDQPFINQYLLWMKGIILRGDLGWSFDYNRPVLEIIGQRIGVSIVTALISTILIWVIAVPVGIYSATHPNSFFDYFFSFFSFLGMAIPGFLLALMAMWIAFTRFGVIFTGLFSEKFIGVDWSMARVMDMLSHLWLPAIVISISGTASIIRVMRGTLQDELKKQYVTTATAKGLSRSAVLLKYPVRVAVNPLISTIGWLLPSIVSGEALVSVVLNIPSIGPLLTTGLQNQDMYLAGSILMILSVLTVIGSLISDILLVLVDPRIRYQEVSK